MRSLILTVLYLAKDTVNRWLCRVSSPLARVLVVFFLSLCALCFLGSYVISAKVIRDRIIREGGDMVHAVIFPQRNGSVALPTAPETEQLLGAESYALESIGSANLSKTDSVPIYTFDFRRSASMYPFMAGEGLPTLLYPASVPQPDGLRDITLSTGEQATVAVRHLPAGHPLQHLLRRGGILITPDAAEKLRGSHTTAGIQHLILRVLNPQHAEDLQRVEDYFNRLLRLEGAGGSVSSAAGLLREMDIVLGNQTQCRAAFCLGIVTIVGILLTALAGMEYRQNEYIYTLMKSFGIRPWLLVTAFLAENTLLVALSFLAAIAVFMHSQVIIVQQFFKTAEYSLSLEEIMPEIELLALALLVCIACSALPILVAAHREIGRVLK